MEEHNALKNNRILSWDKRSSYILMLLIILIAMTLRVNFAINAPLIGDEKEFLAIARTISFDSKNLNLPIEDPLIHHPLLSVYAIKAATCMFGDTALAARIVSLFAAFITLVLICWFTNDTLGGNYAVVTVFLLGFNRFHLGISPLAVEHSLLLLFASLGIFLFWKAITSKSAFYSLASGVSVGLAYLTKETAVLLLACFVIYLIITPQYRSWFRRAQFYVLLSSFYCVIFVDIIWIVKYGSSQRLITGDIFRDLGLGPSGVWFFLIELARYVREVEYYSLVSWEHVPMALPSGLLLLGGSFVTYFKRREDIVSFMGLILFVYILATSIFRNAENHWAEISLIPAVFLSSIFIVDSTKKAKWVVVPLSIFLVFLMLDSFQFTLNARQFLPPQRFEQIADYDTDLMEWLYVNGRIEEAIQEAEEALKICPNEERIHNLLRIFNAKKNDLLGTIKR